MHIFKRSSKASVVSLEDAQGQPCDLRVKFRKGVIHIDADSMEKGKYQIQVSQGKMIERRKFVVA